MSLHEAPNLSYFSSFVSALGYDTQESYQILAEHAITAGNWKLAIRFCEVIECSKNKESNWSGSE